MLRSATTSLMVNADDFGISVESARCIIELAQASRVQSTSCLVTASEWRDCAVLLRDAPPTLQSGLHFNLSQGLPLSAELRRVWPQLPGLASLLLRAHLRQLPLQAIAQEWQAQWECFIDATGRAPHFVDGHQHVIHLPGVREVVLDTLSATFGGQHAGQHADQPAGQPSTPCRNTGQVVGAGHAFKRWVIARSGGRALLQELIGRGIAHNAALVGVYDFGDADYRSLVQRWLAAVPDEGAMLFCHPGAAPHTPGDAIAEARVREAAYLASSAFADDLAAADVSLGAVWTRRSSGD